MIAWVLALLQATASVPAPPPHPPAVPDDAAYAACPGAGALLATASHLSWQQPATLLARHQALRADMGMPPVPDAPIRILWWGKGGDLGTTTFSIVATRTAAGAWHVDGAGQSVIWVAGAKPTPIRRIDRVLDADEGRTLDRLIADPCLRQGPTFTDDPRIVAGGLFNQLEIEQAGGSWRGGWHGTATPQVSAIADLLAR